MDIYKYSKNNTLFYRASGNALLNSKVQEALKGVSVKGVTGDISFDDNGDAKKDMAFIKTVEKGEFKFLETQKV